MSVRAPVVIDPQTSAAMLLIEVLARKFAAAGMLWDANDSADVARVIEYLGDMAVGKVTEAIFEPIDTGDEAFRVMMTVSPSELSPL